MGAAAIPLFFVSTAATLESGRQARQAERRASRAREQISKVRQQREKQMTVKKARIARAQVQAQAEAQGATGSSSAITAESGVTAQEASNLSFLDTLQGLGTFVSSQQSKAAKATETANVFGTAANIASKYANF